MVFPSNEYFMSCGNIDVYRSNNLVVVVEILVLGETELHFKTFRNYTHTGEQRKA